MLQGKKEGVISGFWKIIEDIIRRTESGEIKLDKSVVADGVFYRYSSFGCYIAYRPKDKAVWGTETIGKSQYTYQLMPTVSSTGFMPFLAAFLEYISRYGEPS